MVAINFKAQFVPLIVTGEKLQTIRLRARCKPGDALQLYTAQRTKQCRKIGDAFCKDVMPIHIDFGEHRIETFHDRVRARRTTMMQANDFARADGFADWEQMKAWFAKNHPTLPLNAFAGELITWRDFTPAIAPQKIATAAAARAKGRQAK